MYLYIIINAVERSSMVACEQALSLVPRSTKSLFTGYSMVAHGACLRT